ncbi:MAG: hypothetical protein ACRC67_16940 [Inquilinus sp.]|uniref:hypothetical protein n=1 Tax=Inquilinus sp. TaxID=1932117 RepID=UPI003F2BD6D5
MEMAKLKRERSTLPKPDARRRYVEIGELAVLEQIQRDSIALDGSAIPIGPFARLDAGAVASQDGKTRGAITNLFGSQAAFQTETMALALSAAAWIDQFEFPEPKEFGTSEEWVDAFFLGQSVRGPQHGSKPVISYAYLWALWLSTVPYGLWSQEISRPSMAEYVQWVRRLEQIFAEAINHFALTLRDGTTLTDLACAVASMVEGVWLNQCLTARHPTDSSEPIATALCRAGRLLWCGATKTSPPSEFSDRTIGKTPANASVARPAI